MGASGLLPDMKLGFLALAVIIWTSKSLQFSHFKQETDSRNYPIKDEDVLPKDVSKTVQKAKVHELLLPIKSSSMLKDLFHFPVFVTYKRSDENFEGYNPHVRVIKRSQDFEEDPQIRVMRFDPGTEALNHLSALDRHIRVTRSKEALDPQIRVMRSPKFKNEKSKMDHQIRVMRSDGFLDPQV